METTLMSQIKEVLMTFPEYWDGNILLKTKVIEDVRAYRPDLIQRLFTKEMVKQAYSLKLDDCFVFKIDEFISMLRYKNYWKNSYTRYNNEIGLTTDDKYLKYNSDVVLDFPHKDCVLEGGMTKEDIGKDEIYYHKVLAKEEIDIMFSPKVLTNIKMYDSSGEKEVTKFSNKDNLILKGNNLIALHTIKKRFSGKVKLIYIDPPYNTGKDSFKYNDRYNRSTWLTFMKNRLEIAKELMTDDGTIWINIDSNESHYLKVLMDSIFGENNFIADVIWNHTKQSKNDERFFSRHYNHLLVYSKDKDSLTPFKLPRTEEDNKNYKNPDNDPKGLWRSGDVRSPNLRPTLKFNITAPDGTVIKPPNNGWRWSKETVEEKIKTKEIIFKPDNSGIIRKIYLADQVGRTPENIWYSSETGTTREANAELKALFGSSVFSTPKPERLLQRIIQLGSNENDIVLDFFMGSATTQAVAMKMKRQFIGIEQMEYIETVSIPRLKKVIEGEQGGISKDVGWTSGDNFIYAELYQLNQKYVDNILKANSNEEIESLIEIIKECAFLDFKINIDKVTNAHSDFALLSLDEKKKVLIKTLDSNQLYLSYSEINDKQYDLPESVKQFNNSFYNQKVVKNHE